MIRAAIRAADALDVPYCIAVVDAGGHLLSFTRQDGALIGCVDLAIGKARTARIFDKSTQQLNHLAQPGADLYGIQHSNGGAVVLIGGGVPIVYDNVIIGAVGASGGTVEQDIAVCNAAVAAIAH
ncbi:heme-binding protein [Bosea sp. AK1]|uniref:GlcG/HbpS family heme-binding protein n=1 Tax=Bosea sp. AK1 TaxID=2587160 RepID=UPI0020C0F103|nr:heme-binding protein [Bosea sp. AK1]